MCDDRETKNTNMGSRYECPICLSLLQDPLLTSCGHRFCSQCINKWLARGDARCPIDNSVLQPESDLFRDLYTKREILQEQTKFKNEELALPVASTTSLTQSHVDGIAQQFRICEQYAVENAIIEKSNFVQVFEEESNQVKLSQEILKDGTMMESVISTDASDKAEINQTAVEGTSGEADSFTELFHDKLETNWKKLIKQLYERIVTLEQQNRELSITVENHQATISSLQHLMTLKQDPIYAKNCHGSFIWRLNSFDQEIKALILDSSKMIYSPGFYTNPNGYKICARMNISSKNPEFLSIVLHIMKSENDDALDWPFSGIIYFTLIHPTIPEKSVKEKAVSSPHLEAFRKPLSALNKRSFGYTEFISLSDVGEFLLNNQLILRIEVRTHY